jgi:predicted RNase H-like HicB family nuclease
MDVQFTAVFRRVPEGFIGFVEELPGANTQGATLEEARANLEEAAELILGAKRTLLEEELEGAVHLIRHIEQHRCELLRVGGNHSVYVNRTARKTSTVPRHREVNGLPRAEDLPRSRGARTVAPNMRVQRTR